MAFARDVYTATASQTDFTISYPYQAEEDVTVYQNGVLLDPADYTFPNATTVRLDTGATLSDTIVLQRNTSQDARDVDFNAGPLTEADLDNANIQNFYMAQEVLDQVGLGLKKATDEIWDATSIRIKNVATPSESTDAVTKAYVDAISAAAGNVPTPGDPADDDKILTASGGSFTWEVPADQTPADNSITLAKMEHGTSGDVLYYGASGTPTRLAKGSDGEVLGLTSGLPAWQAGTPTGAVMDFMLASAPTGWLELDGDTIGDTGSGATHTGAAYEDLYTALWDNVADAQAAVSTGRGGSAAFDWSAGKTLTLPDATGRATYGLEASSTRLTAQDIDGATLGDTGGDESHTLLAAEMPSHTHTYTTVSGTTNTSETAGFAAYSSTTGSNTGPAGSDGAHNNLSPGIVTLKCIKL